ncbi:MAG TPA: radical SAM protein, partial [Methanocorpusculum sp.]|nr:radical SAM protein [Methanocorpusculum sp.]
MTSNAIIIDGYVDEPACLGVPPYISPYIRTVAGVLVEHGIPTDYVTIDQLRKDPIRISELCKYSYVVMIAGVTVPGKYLSGTPATLTELQQIGLTIRGKTISLLGGPIMFGWSPQGGKKAVSIDSVYRYWTVLLQGDPATALDSYLCGNDVTDGKLRLQYLDYNRWAKLGANIITKHPFYPYVMCELETSKGCYHGITGGCSFCTEPFYGSPIQRDVSDVSEEVSALYQSGARHFRVGRQPDLLAFGTTDRHTEFPNPNPDALRKLFTEIRNSAPLLETLHIDNVNPGTIARHEETSRDALIAIIEGHTSGDVAAFGIESVDPAVISANNLKVTEDMAYRAIEIVNEVGSKRRDGVPELLPGLNFI